jgi:hypothetical protein
MFVTRIPEFFIGHSLWVLQRYLMMFEMRHFATSEDEVAGIMLFPNLTHAVTEMMRQWSEHIRAFKTKKLNSMV